MYFLDHDASLLNLGIPSIEQKFNEARSTDPASLSPDLLFEILDATTVRRTRKYVQEYYPEDAIEIDGERKKITFDRNWRHSSF